MNESLPATTELDTEVSELVVRANAIAVILDDVSYSAACEFLTKDVKLLEKQIVEFFKPLKSKAHEAWKAIVSAETEQLRPVTQAQEKLKIAIGGYRAEQERKRLEEQRRLEEEARKLEEERRLDEAAHLESEGDIAAATALMEAPVVAPVIRMPAATPKVSGVSVRENWSAQVVDLHALVKFVAANPQYSNLILPNATALNQTAKAMKSAMNIPGVKAVVNKVVAAGAR